MKATVTATQKIEYKIPTLPVNIVTTTGNMPLETISETAIEDIFEALKQNAIEYMKQRNKDIKDFTGKKLEDGDEVKKK